jgi:hypothetical protein
MEASTKTAEGCFLRQFTIEKKNRVPHTKGVISREGRAYKGSCERRKGALRGRSVGS